MGLARPKATLSRTVLRAVDRARSPAVDDCATLLRGGGCRLPFELRNFTTVGSVKRVSEQICQSPSAVALSFQDRRVRARSQGDGSGIEWQRSATKRYWGWQNNAVLAALLATTSTGRSWKHAE